MKPGRFIIAILALTLLGLSAAAPAHAAKVSRFNFKGQSANAFFSSTDPNDPCIVTEVFVEATEARVKDEPSGPTSVSEVFIAISQFNVCTDELLWWDAFGTATLAADAFQVDTQLQSATLNATVEVCDFLSDTCFPVDINLAWTGTGELTRGKSAFHFDTPSCKVRSRFMGTFRDAVATGSVVGLGSNLTPDPTVFAQLDDVKNGSITLGCEP